MFFGIRDPGSEIRDPRSGIRDPGSGIRDGKNPDPGSGINIPDPQHWCYSYILIVSALIDQFLNAFLKQNEMLTKSFC